MLRRSSDRRAWRSSTRCTTRRTSASSACATSAPGTHMADGYARASGGAGRLPRRTERTGRHQPRHRSRTGARGVFAAWSRSRAVVDRARLSRRVPGSRPAGALPPRHQEDVDRHACLAHPGDDRARHSARRWRRGAVRSRSTSRATCCAETCDAGGVRRRNDPARLPRRRMTTRSSVRGRGCVRAAKRTAHHRGRRRQERTRSRRAGARPRRSAHAPVTMSPGHGDAIPTSDPLLRRTGRDRAANVVASGARYARPTSSSRSARGSDSTRPSTPGTT